MYLMYVTLLSCLAASHVLSGTVYTLLIDCFIIYSNVRNNRKCIDSNLTMNFVLSGVLLLDIGLLCWYTKHAVKELWEQSFLACIQAEL